MFRPHCSHLQANLHRSSAFNVRTIWDPTVCTIVMCGYITHITIVHTMGSQIVRTMKALDLCKLA